eukprot:m.219331 g.219331  ORF g.219331 m.219331 type:complete len:115 (-) comp10791_c8_seq3:527-871(-)
MLSRIRWLRRCVSTFWASRSRSAATTARVGAVRPHARAMSCSGAHKPRAVLAAIHFYRMSTKIDPNIERRAYDILNPRAGPPPPAADSAAAAAAAAAAATWAAAATATATALGG